VLTAAERCSWRHLRRAGCSQRAHKTRRKTSLSIRPLSSIHPLVHKSVAPCVRIKTHSLTPSSTHPTLLCAPRYIALSELKNLMKNLGEGLNDEEITGMEKVAQADDEDQVNIRHMVDQLMQE
jgi:hypothetical protein